MYVNEYISSVHEGKRSFHCSICKKSFLEKSSMKKNISSVHEGPKINCSLCEKSCTRKQQLKLSHQFMKERRSNFLVLSALLDCQQIKSENDTFQDFMRGQNLWNVSYVIRVFQNKTCSKDML